MSSAARPRKTKSGKRKKKKDINAPKRPRSAYILYCAEKRNEAKADHPDAKPAELMKILGDLWNQLPAAKKVEFTEKAKEDKQRYSEQMKNYTPPEPDSDDDAPPSKRSRGKRGKKKRDPSEPKRPPSAYLIYGQKIRDQIKVEFPDLKSSEIMQKIGERWQKLTEDEKKPYNDDAATGKARYESQKAEYKAKKDDERAARVEAEDEDDAGDVGAGGDDDDDDVDDADDNEEDDE